MKLKSLSIKNIKSFNEEVKIEFDEKFNILIGPNGGGKSNLLDIITIIIRHFFLRGFKIEEGKDTTRYFKNINPFTPFRDIHKALNKFKGNTGESSVKVTLKVGEEDINNMQQIKLQKEKYEQIIKEYKSQPNIEFMNQWDFNILKKNQELGYEINENKLTKPENNTPEGIFLTYLNYIELFIALTKEIEGVALKPAFLYFSPYRIIRHEELQADIRSEDYYNFLSNYYDFNSNNQMSLLKLSTLYLALKRHKYASEAEQEGFLKKWDNDEEVIFINKYMKKLGYFWNFEKKDINGFVYESVISNVSETLSINNASSGEKEIINFLLGILSFNIKNGLVVIDEPELHLHAKWQSALIDLFLELADRSLNQFIIATHSSSFIRTNTISNVLRVFKDKGNASKVVYFDKSNLKNAKDLLHIVNSQNNERMFFADKVVLVEGIQDRIVFQKLTEYFTKSENQTSQILEVLDVLGKYELLKYRKFLDNFEVNNYIIADRDYLYEIGDSEVKKLFQKDIEKVEKKILKDKKSKDRIALISALEQGIEDKDAKGVLSILEHLKSRFKKFKPNLTEQETMLFNKNIEKLKNKKNIFILKNGEIEDYLPDGSKDLEQTIELIKEKNFEDWISNIEKDEGLKELKNIVTDILGKQAEAHKEIEVIEL